MDGKGCGLGVASCELRVAGCGLRVVGCLILDARCSYPADIESRPKAKAATEFTENTESSKFLDAD